MHLRDHVGSLKTLELNDVVRFISLPLGKSSEIGSETDTVGGRASTAA